MLWQKLISSTHLLGEIWICISSNIFSIIICIFWTSFNLTSQKLKVGKVSVSLTHKKIHPHAHRCSTAVVLLFQLMTSHRGSVGYNISQSLFPWESFCCNLLIIRMLPFHSLSTTTWFKNHNSFFFFFLTGDIPDFIFKVVVTKSDDPLKT